MSGNKTYIGPFGRILPVPDDHEAPERVLGPLDETRSTTMAMYNLPRPALDFGSDNRGFTDPLRYSSQRNGPPLAVRHDRSGSSEERPRAIDYESLPGVERLLTPATRSNVPQSLYPLHQSPERRSSLFAAQAQATESSRRDAEQTHQSNYQSSHPPPVPQFAQMSATRRDSYPTDYSPQLPPPPLFPHTYVTNPPSHQTPYTAYVSQTHQVPYLPQGLPPTAYPLPFQQQQSSAPNTVSIPQQSFPSASPVQYYADAAGPSNVPTNSAGSPEESEKSADNPVKPKPRVVREDILPGEGPVWVYEDGSTCPKVIDGEPVNAEWGVTKAGKPRKRLAIACTTCREKKIKCQPALPKCAQCEKFGRECHYATAPRVQHAPLKTSSYEFQARNKPLTIKAEPHHRVLLPLAVKPEPYDDHVLAKRRDSSPNHKELQPVYDRMSRRQSTNPPIKKQRSDFPSYSLKVEISAASNKRSGIESTPSTATVSCVEDPLRLQTGRYKWGTDPYEVDAQATSHYVEMYFVHVNAAGHRLFPHRSFVHWLENDDSKTPDDMMLIYAILALGTTFSARHDRKSDGHLFVQVAQSAIERRLHKHSLHLVQSCIILGLYYFATGTSPGGWDVIEQGLRAALGLNLNVEESLQDVEDDDGPPFGLHNYAFRECCRRTYWSAYIVDRCVLLNSGHMPMLQSQNSLLRLPCDEDIYRRQKASNAPFFYKNRHRGSDSDATLSPMAYIVEISAIWGEVLTFNRRHAREPAGEYASNYDKYYRENVRRLSDWKTSLSKDMDYTPSNVSSSIENGSIGIFLEIHALYHATVMKLNRTVRHQSLPPVSGSRNFNKARKQALEVLKMMEVIVAASRSSKNLLDVSGNLPEFPDEALESCSALAGSSPFTGYTVLLAIDILAAGGIVNPGPFRDLTSSMKAGLAVVEELSQCWSSAAEQKRVILRRLESLCSSVASRPAGGVQKKVWRYKTALDTALQSGQDLFYNDVENVRDPFFDYLDINVMGDEILYID